MRCLMLANNIYLSDPGARLDSFGEIGFISRNKTGGHLPSAERFAEKERPPKNNNRLFYQNHFARDRTAVGSQSVEVCP